MISVFSILRRGPFDSRSVAAILCAMVALAVAQPARAGGIYANEFGTPEMGTAGAGAEASALDASTAIPFYNPAGMTLLEGNQVIVAAGALFPSVEFEVDETDFTGGNGGQAGDTVPILTAAYVHSFSERFKFGVALFAAAGAALEYDPDWAGRYQAQSSEIAAVSLSPTLAYRINEWFSIGGGLNIMATALETKVAVPRLLQPDGQVAIDGTDTQLSFNLSAMFEPGEKTRIGVAYVSETEFDYAGDVSFSNAGLVAPVNTTLTLAQFLRIGVHHEILAPGPRSSPHRRAPVPHRPPRPRWAAGRWRGRADRNGHAAAELGRHLSLRRGFPLPGGSTLAAAFRRELRHLADGGRGSHSRLARGRPAADQRRVPEPAG